jgi:hypothetical protein
VTIHHFGTSVDGSVFLEQTPSTPPANAVATDAPQRPARGLHLRVRNPLDGSDLPDIVTSDYGYWDYTTQDVPIIWVSADNFQSQLSIRSTEAMDAAVNANLDLAAFETLAETANANANAALALAQANTGSIESVNGQTGTVILTAADVQARPTGVNVPAAEVSGLAPVAKSGSYADLTNAPAASVPLSLVGATNGVAPLGSDKKVPAIYLPATSGGGIGAVTLDNIPSGSIISSDTTTRPTTRTDVRVFFDTAMDPGSNALDGDKWFTQ